MANFRQSLSLRALVQAIALLFLISLLLAFIFGIPENCISVYGIQSCQGANLRAWWNDNAQISLETIHANLYVNSHPSGLSRLLAPFVEPAAYPGTRIWNLFATNVVTRILLGLLATNAIYDLLKAVALALFRESKPKEAKEAAKIKAAED